MPHERDRHPRARTVWIILAIAFALSLTLSTIYSVRDGAVQWTSTLNMAGMLVLALSFVVPPARRPMRLALVVGALTLLAAAFALLARGFLS